MLKIISSKRAPKAVRNYSTATRVNDLIFTSVQLPINGKTNTIEYSNDIQRQTKQCMNNTKVILEVNGTEMDKIIKTTVFLANINAFSKFDEIYQSFFTNKYPARTFFEVGTLPMDAII